MKEKALLIAVLEEALQSEKYSASEKVIIKDHIEKLKSNKITIEDVILFIVKILKVGSNFFDEL